MKKKKLKTYALKRIINTHKNPMLFQAVQSGPFFSNMERHGVYTSVRIIILHGAF